MFKIKLRWLSTATCIFGCLLLFPAIAPSQTKPDPSTNNQDVIKFDTSLVQTDVMVFDKKGRFVDGLKPEQFQLKIDSKDREISFFERVESGGPRNRREELNAPLPKSVNPSESVKPGQPALQGRAVIFFVR
jgi:hypothetical protein